MKLLLPGSTVESPKMKKALLLVVVSGNGSPHAPSPLPQNSNTDDIIIMVMEVKHLPNSEISLAITNMNCSSFLQSTP